jgi:hypothetical protein
MTIPAGTIKRIHVNRHILASNKQTGREVAAITIQTSKGSIRASEVTIYGEVTFQQAGQLDGGGEIIQPLSCGARVWAVTSDRIEYKDELGRRS